VTETAASNTQCLVKTLCSSKTVHGHTAHVLCNSWTAASRNARLFSPNLWPSNSADLNPMGYEIWAVTQRHVYQRQIHSVDELKRRLIDVWCGLEQSIFDEAIDQWRGSHRACVLATGHFEYSLWTDNVDFVHVHCVPKKRPPFYFWNNVVRINRFQ